MACTACGKCVLDAAPGLISVASGVAVVDYDRIALAEERAVTRCPTGAIVWLKGAQFATELDPSRVRRRHEDLGQDQGRCGHRDGSAISRGSAQALDGSSAVVAMETAASEAAGAYPITPSTQMGEGWAAAVAAGSRTSTAAGCCSSSPRASTPPPRSPPA